MNGIYAPLLSSAQEAIAIGNSIKTNSPAINLLDGHEIVHWSHYALVGTCVVGIITGIASAILTQWPLVIACGIMAVSTGLGAYYIKELSIADALAEIIQKLVVTIQDLYKGVQELYNQIKDLKTAKSDLQNVVNAYTSTVENGSAELGDQAKKLQEIANELKASEKKYSELKSLYDPLKQTVDAFVSSSGKLLSGLENLKEEGHILSSSVDGLEKIEKEFDSEVDELGTNAKKMSDENKLALSYIQKLTQTVEFFQKIYPQLVKENELQQIELVELRAAQEGQGKTVAELRATIDNYEAKVLPAMQEIMAHLPVDVLRELNAKLEALKR